MFEGLEKYDKESTRTIYIKTDAFNELLTHANCDVKVIPRKEGLSASYIIYSEKCKEAGDVPISKERFENERYPHYRICYDFSECMDKHENADCGQIIADALGVRNISIQYAYDNRRKLTDDELTVSYQV